MTERVVVVPTARQIAGDALGFGVGVGLISGLVEGDPASEFPFRVLVFALVSLIGNGTWHAVRFLLARRRGQRVVRGRSEGAAD